MFASLKPRRRLALFAPLAALILAAAVFAPASADVPEGATFVDGADLDVTLIVGQAFTVNLDVINGGEDSARFTIAILNVQAPVPGYVPFAPPPDETGVIARSPTTIAAGAVWNQAVTVAVDAAVGLYSGQFVVTGSDGTIDQRGFRLTVNPWAGSFGGATSPGFTEPMPDITLFVERSSLPFSEANPAPDVFFPVDPLLAPRILPGELISTNGERAGSSIASNGYVTITAHGPGAYKGVLARTNPGGEVNPLPLADITLTVRDDWWAALFLLVFALLAGLALEWFATDSVPKSSLRVRLADLRDAAEKATNAHEAWMESFRGWPGQPGSPHITGESGLGRDTDGAVTEIAPYLVTASARALQDFDALGAVDSRARRWAADGEEYVKLAAAEQTFESLLRARQHLAVEWLRFVAEMAEAQKHRTGRPTLDELAQKSDTRRAVRDALASDIIASAAELERRTKLVADTLAMVGTLEDLVRSLWTIDHWMPDTSAYAAAIDPLWMQLASMPNPATDVEILRTAARELLDKVIADRSNGRGAAAESSADDATLAAIEIAARRPAARTPAVAAITETSSYARLQRLWVNVRYGILISVIALVTGLATQYYANATFGSISDYLGVVTWGVGAVVAGGLLKNLGSVAGVVGLGRAR